MDPLILLVRALHERNVRFVVIGVGGANYHALSGGTVFTTKDSDLFIPPDPDNLVSAWSACDAVGLSLWSGNEPLDLPRDRWLAERVVATRSVTRADNPQGLLVDLSVTMATFEFEEVWQERRIFQVEGVGVPVARLEHIVRSKAAVGRPKDQLFLATHEDALKQMFPRLANGPKSE